MKSYQMPYFDSYAEHLFEKTEEEKVEETCRSIIKENPQNAPSIIAKRVMSNREIEQKEVQGLIEEEQERARRLIEKEQERAQRLIKKEQEKAQELIKKAQEQIEEAEDKVQKERQRADDAIEKRKALEKKFRRMKNRIIKTCLWLGVAFILTVLFEYVVHKWVLLVVTGSAGGAGVLLNVIEKVVEIFGGSLFSREKTGADEPRPEEEMEGLFKKVKAFFDRVRRKRGVGIAAFGMTACLLAGILVRFDACEQTVRFCQGGYAALTDSVDTARNMVTMGISVGVSRGEDMLPPEQPGVTVAVEAKRYLTGSNEGLIQQLDSSSITWEDINLVLNLSNEDYNILFFLEGLEAGIYESQDQLNQRVLETVQVHTEANQENIFDRKPDEGGPDQDTLNIISRVSDLEEESIDFSETKDILIIREGVNQIYPKRTLTQLVSNGYHRLALLLFWHGGQEATVVYYYGQSILFGMECLKFADNTGMTIKEKLLFIAQRYEDIAYTCPGFRDARRARMLAEAFRYAADRF